MKRMIIYNAYNYGTVFFLAAAKQAGYQPVSASTPSALWASNAEEIILCNVNPKLIPVSIQYHPDISLYLREKINLITDTIFYPFTEWDQKNLTLNQLMNRVYNESMRKNDRDIESGNWQRNEEAARYARALKAAMVKGMNTNWEIYEVIFQEAINEIANNQTSGLIESFYELYDRVQETTDRAIARLELNTLIHIPKRKIAFGYLDNVSDYLDFSRLRRACLDRYPYLAIIQYRQGGKDLTWLISNKKLEVCQFFRLPQRRKYETIIIAPHKDVLQHLQNVIAELQQ